MEIVGYTCRSSIGKILTYGVSSTADVDSDRLRLDRVEAQLMIAAARRLSSLLSTNLPAASHLRSSLTKLQTGAKEHRTAVYLRPGGKRCIVTINNRMDARMNTP